MADKVLDDILTEVKEAKFFSLLVDETPDIAHQEQVSFIVRYVDSKCAIRGQGYDGAASMSGQYSGLQSRIAAENEKAIYVHCHAHNLQFTVT